MNLSKHFTLKEMTVSTTAIRLGIDNSPSLDVINNLINISERVLEPLREFMGEPIRISSGYRSVELNKKIGGSKTSQHCLGEAVDITCFDKNNEMFNFIKDNLKFDQLIWEFGNSSEPDWVHVSYRSNSSDNRGEVLIAKKVKGKTVYEKYV
jgi:zinc D-Ala-D-Ala carboxypeptidase